jgi:carbon-monoxide dehydrogenase small subunit
MLMLGVGLLAHNPHPTRAEIVEAMGGNICRCTGYQPIIRAIEATAAGATGSVSPPEAPAATEVAR